MTLVLIAALPIGAQWEAQHASLRWSPQATFSSMAGSPDPGTDPSEAAGELQVEEIRTALLLPAGCLVRALHHLFHYVLRLPPPQVP